MSRDHKVLVYGLLLCAAALTCFLCWGIVGARQDSKDATAALVGVSKRLDDTITNINRPCKGPKGPDACGALAQINKVEIAVSDAVITTQLQVKNSQKLMDAAAQSILRASSDVHKATVAATGTITAAQSTLNQATADLKTANTVIASAQAPIEKLTEVETAGGATIQHLDALLSDPRIGQMMANGVKITASGASIANSTDLVFKKEAASITNPPHGIKAQLEKYEPVGMIGLKVFACLYAGSC